MFLPPVWERGLIFVWKNVKKYVFAKDLYLRKNGKFELLGWFNEFWDPFSIVIKSTSSQWNTPLFVFEYF